MLYFECQTNRIFPTRGESVSTSVKTHSPALHPLWVGKVCLATKELCVFRRAALLCAFLFGVMRMDAAISRFENLALIYDIVLDLSKALEEEVKNGCRDYDKILILSGCYSVVDHMANQIGALGIDDNAYPESNVKADHYLVVPKLMEIFAKELEGNLCDECCPSCIDYKKVQALAGLRTVIPYIEQLTRILVD